jgi:DNA-binding MarR family transcriptional regulator
MGATAPLFKSVELTPTQYNALRILRGAGEDGLSCSEVSERMITRESDITRLLDRLENSGWIMRERPSTNRRLVLARITPAGLNLLSLLDEPLVAGHRRLVGHLGAEKLTQLIELLEEIRTPEEEI